MSVLQSNKARRFLFLVGIFAILAILDPSREVERHLQTAAIDTDEQESETVTKSSAIKPIMATFFEVVDEGCCGMTKEGHENLLRAWEDSWQAVGWETKILTKEDAMKHPDFDLLDEKLKNVYVSPYNRRCMWRWLAMAMNEDEHGGWMSDYDLFPLTLTGEMGLKLAEEPGFKTWAGHVPALIHSDRESWDKVLHMMMDNIPEDRKAGMPMVTDMFLLQFLHEFHKKEMNVTEWRSKVLGGFPYAPPSEEHDEPVINCKLAKMAFAAHLSHHDVEEAMEKWHKYPKIEGMKSWEHTERRGEAARVMMNDFRDKCLE
mmetsp:Transcript_3250/g.4991  ORF Transcript_3250/g.4991 Transcript_3250/m.4991 type:complete len:317 (+) Transcript_3250:113-1063(+)